MKTQLSDKCLTFPEIGSIFCILSTALLSTYIPSREATPSPPMGHFGIEWDRFFAPSLSNASYPERFSLTAEHAEIAESQCREEFMSNCAKAASALCATKTRISILSISPHCKAVASCFFGKVQWSCGKFGYVGLAKNQRGAHRLVPLGS
ncbi:MAG: hypothetical protein ABSB74_19360, partial [Tepidisphaeraceae bacterium]